MFLTVYLSNSEKHVAEVPVTPETLCQDVVDVCKEPGETDCYLAESWRGSGEDVATSFRFIVDLRTAALSHPKITHCPRSKNVTHKWKSKRLKFEAFITLLFSSTAFCWIESLPRSRWSNGDPADWTAHVVSSYRARDRWRREDNGDAAALGPAEVRRPLCSPARASAEPWHRWERECVMRRMKPDTFYLYLSIRTRNGSETDILYVIKLSTLTHTHSAEQMWVTVGGVSS